MKKIILTLVITLSMILTLSCGNNNASGEENNQDQSMSDIGTEGDESLNSDTTNSTGKLGLGVISDKSSSHTGKASIYHTAAAVMLDSDGKIQKCRIDSTENNLNITDGKLPQNNEETSFLSKRELGDNYNMKSASTIDKEWYEQVDFFEDYIVGMTAKEVSAISVNTDQEGNRYASDEVLYAGCTISIGNFINAVEKACEDTQSYSFGYSDTDEIKIGLSMTSYLDSSSSDATAVTDGKASIYTDFGAVITDNDGKTIASVIDLIQPSVNFDQSGEIISNDNGTVKTKRELGEDYGLKEYSSIGKEWYEQARSFCDYTVGKTSVDINSIMTEEKDGHNVASDEILYAGCTIGIDDFKEIVSKAIDNAK